MKVFHIDEFKCTLCSNWFCPPFNLPYRLKCTHSICTNCLQKSVENKSKQIICPEDLQKNKIDEINLNHSTKKALQRLLKQHNNFTNTNHLQCIKSLSLSFDQLLDSKQIQLKNLSTLMDQIFQNQIKRLRQIYQKIKIEINRPFRIVNDWKEVVRNYLKKIKQKPSSLKPSLKEFNHYIQEGRKIKLDLNQYLKHDFRQLIDQLLLQPQLCFTHQFSIFNNFQNQNQRNHFGSENKQNNFKRGGDQKSGESYQNYCSTSKFQTLGKTFPNQKELNLQNVIYNLDQSSIRGIKQPNKTDQHSNKHSLFEDLIQETPKNYKFLYQNTKNTPLKQMIFSSSSNIKQDANLKQDKYNRNYTKNNIETKHSQQLTSPNKYHTQTLNKYCPQSGEKNYNQLIKDKIKKQKAKPTLQSTKKQKSSLNKIEKSLQYSPEQIYSSQPYTVQDSFQQNTSYQYKNDNLSLHSLEQQQTAIENQSSSIHTYTSLNQKQYQSFHSHPNSFQPLQEEMLLDQKYHNLKPQTKNHWELENLNFLKEWKINKNDKPQQEIEIIQKYGQYNCQKQKNKYARKIEQHRLKLILQQTNIQQNFIEIVGNSLADCNLTLLLSQIDWNERNIEIVKFIKTSLTDYQLNQLLNFMLRSNVHTLMLSYNNLSELSLDALLNFVELNDKLKNIYLPKNNISLLKGNARAKINLLKEKGINLYI